MIQKQKKLGGNKLAFAANGTSALVLKNYLLKSYNVGEYSRYLKIRSACDKGRSENYRRPVEESLTYPYISPNSDFNIAWIVFDIDRYFNPYELYDRNLPLPTFIVFNPKSGYAHLWYKLKNPVYCQGSFKKSKPYKYYRAVCKALCKALGADSHFSGKLCKNPLYPEWKTIQFSDSEYSLADLAAHLDLNWKEKKKNKYTAKKISAYDSAEEFSGAEKGSRNSSLFDYCRFKAYHKRMTADCSESDFVEWCVDCVREADKKNPYPLGEEDEKEIRQIGESIGYWTWANLDVLSVTQSKYDDADRERSLKVRQRKAAKKLKKIERYMKKHPDASNRAISRALGEGYSTDTVNKAIKKIKAAQQAAAEQSKASAAEVVGLLPPLHIVGERFVNQVVVPVGDSNGVGG